ncbi:MAG TPA: anthranilate/aminodeoxychorismate synthase component II, partial [Turneriella sp.]|nr:anthranilate/aminodeoxychorismate synthase component II [Turneriella sp.]
MIRILLVDNYDSFTYNLYQYMGEVMEESGKPFRIDVVRNDEKSYEDLNSASYDRVVISPGPGNPS